MKILRLLNRDGTLYFPHGGCGEREDSPSLLLRRYDAGDVDTIPWPMYSDFATKADLEHRLASALYDERECNPFFEFNAVIELPDGTVFEFDEVLCRAEHHIESPDYDPAQKAR